MTATWILLGLSLLCIAGFLYPYFIYPAVLRLLSQQPVRKRPTDLRPSLLFCAHNEKDCLPAKIENLRQLKKQRPDLQILVYDDSSSDGSFELLSAASDVLTTVRGTGRTGKAAGMKQLVSHATGDVLIFTDANVLLAPDMVERLIPYYADPQVGGLSGTIQTLDHPNSLTSQVGSTYVALDDRLQELESRTGNVMGASGGLFSIRRELYPDFPDTVQDDFTVSMGVIFQGKRLVKAPDVIAYERAVSRRGEEIRRKMRIGARAYHTHAFMRSKLRAMSLRDRLKYVSRKMLRWFGGLFLAAAFLFALAAAFTISTSAAVLFLLGVSLAAALAIGSNEGPLAKLGEFAVAVFATLAGILQGMRGRTAATWAPAKSR